MVESVEGMMVIEETDTMIVGETDLAVVRRFPVIWDRSESGAPWLFDHTQRVFADLDTAAFRVAIRSAEVLLDEGELAPAHYEYDDPLRDAPTALKPFASRGLAEIHDGRVGVDVTANGTCE
jgi:hypothetical protein